MERDTCLIATAQRPNCSCNNILHIFTEHARNGHISASDLRTLSVDFFIEKAKSPPYFYFRFIWPTDLESVPRVEPPTLIISTKFEVDNVAVGRSLFAFFTLLICSLAVRSHLLFHTC